MTHTHRTGVVKLTLRICGKCRYENCVFFSGNVITGPFNWIFIYLLAIRKNTLTGYAGNCSFHAVTSVRAESNIFKKMPYFPKLLQFSELLGEDFGFNPYPTNVENRVSS